MGSDRATHDKFVTYTKESSHAGVMTSGSSDGRDPSNQSIESTRPS